MYIIAFYLLVFLVIVIGLRLYTNHGKSYPVPDFKGLSMDRVQQLAEYNNLRVEIADSTFVNYLPKGNVIDQHPMAGEYVKKNRKIFLTTNAYNRMKVEMPNVVGVSFRQGKSSLEMIGLKIGKLIYRPDFAKNNILKQMYQGEEIEKGTMIEKGETIDLVLGNGLGRSLCVIPNLYKNSYTRALSNINDCFFNVGEVTFDESVQTSQDSLNAKVLSQEPEYSRSSRALIGSSVNIILSIDEEKFAEKDSLIMLKEQELMDKLNETENE